MAVRSTRGARRPTDAPAAGARAIPDEVVKILGLLPMASLIVDDQGAVLRSTPRAEALGLVRRDALVVSDVAELVRLSAEKGTTRERQVRVRRPPLGRGMLDLKLVVSPLMPGVFVVLIEDLADERRVDAVRRDFVANVSHELKTPVGAMSLLAEAILSAADDPAEVRRFADRMLMESARLSSLINDIIDLSRLQGDDPLTHAEVVDLETLVAQAVEEVRTLALAHGIEIVVSADGAPLLIGQRVLVKFMKPGFKAGEKRLPPKPAAGAN